MAQPVPEDDTRRRILDAAGPIFAQMGFSKATVRDICSAAKVNVASVGYHFGDKMGLYLSLVRQIRKAREAAFPMPELEGTAEQHLYQQVYLLLQRMQSGDCSGWEAQLMMREMQNPTEAFREMVEEYFRPLFERIQQTAAEILQAPVAPHQLEQIALSIVGQCFHFRVSEKTIQQLIPAPRLSAHYGLEDLACHVSAFTLASLTSASYNECLSRFHESSCHE
ncbi:putative HTH-type transcriptional regulator YttP [Roseimaritima multifibrata]|uniref:Putative HTH-type transcriptional regulator YttP n=1 Tax=Roseimaritima multifibrata TaxID=1930274 RepID=A0A517MCL4_9BACT|nr:CerR family C-terminal domain-containing protein [Roseimaritima multifibrata]QDS92517.1 putative HTH-type transcriptional regulator YttP [Roseimaritima multifibrata]